MPASSARPGPRLRDVALALYPLALVGLTLLALVAPRRDGALALAQVFAHYLFLPALLLLPLALGRGMILLRLALAATAAIFLLVYPPALNLAPRVPPPAAPRLRVLSWNVFVGGATPAAMRAAIAEHDPDVVLLQELIWEELAGDPELAARYPYQLLRPGETAPSLAIFSRHPIVASGVPELPGDGWDMERIVWARLDLGGQTVTLVNAHPIPPRTFERGCPPLSCYNRGPRDDQIAQMRAFAEELRLRTGDPLVLAGDMNVTEREEAYFDLAAGLRDLHRAAGSGFGASWRPDDLGLPAGLIRIDYIFASEGLRPLGLTTDCAARGSDHCLLVGDLALTDVPVVGRP
jgi:vancomycin resistance protein VanJ